MQRFKNFIANLHFPRFQNINKKKVFSFFTFLFLLTGVGISAYLVQQKQEVRKKAAVENLVTASLVTNKTNVLPNETFDVKVKFTPNPTLKVSAASIIVKYDDANNPNNLLTLTNIQAGPFFLKSHDQEGRLTEMLNVVDIATEGLAKIYLGAPCAVCGPTPEFSCNPGMDCCTCYPQSQEDDYAILTFQANTIGDAVINLETDSQAAAVGQDLRNVLYLSDSLKSLTINIASSANPTNTPIPTATDTPIPTNTPVPTNTPKPTSTPRPTPTTIPTEPPVPTPTAIPNTSNLLLQLKLEGINKQSTNKNFLVTLFNTQTQNKIQETIRFVSDGAGVYSGGVYNIPQGTYKIYAKGPYHLQKLFEEITFSATDADQTLTRDYTATPLLRGDTNGDNKINMQDILAIVNVWYVDKTTVDATNFNYDINEDGFITMQDILAVVNNWIEDPSWGDKLPNE